jgi:hypothetical protein
MVFSLKGVRIILYLQKQVTGCTHNPGRGHTEVANWSLRYLMSIAWTRVPDGTLDSLSTGRFPGAGGEADAISRMVTNATNTGGQRVVHTNW